MQLFRKRQKITSRSQGTLQTYLCWAAWLGPSLSWCLVSRGCFVTAFWPGPVPKRGRTPPGQSRQQLAPRSENCTWAVICFGRSHGVCLSCAPTAGSVSAWTLDAVSVPPRLLQLSEETDGSRRTVPLWCRSPAGAAGEGSPRLPPGGAAHAPWGGAAILVPPGAAASGGHLSAPLPQGRPCPRQPPRHPAGGEWWQRRGHPEEWGEHLVNGGSGRGGRAFGWCPLGSGAGSLFESDAGECRRLGSRDRVKLVSPAPVPLHWWQRGASGKKDPAPASEGRGGGTLRHVSFAKCLPLLYISVLMFANKQIPFL